MATQTPQTFDTTLNALMLAIGRHTLIEALTGPTTTAPKATRRVKATAARKPVKRKMSAAGRLAISRAAKARWRKYNAQKRAKLAKTK